MPQLVQDPAILPTYCFAVYDGTQDGQSHLYPCHVLPVLTHCTTISRSQLTTLPPTSNSLPVIPLQLPSPEYFPILQDFMYTRSSCNLLSALLPPNMLPSITNFKILIDIPVVSMRPMALLSLARKIHGTWGNVCSLGIADTELWQTLQLAWTILLKSMTQSNGRRSTRSNALI